MKVFMLCLFAITSFCVQLAFTPLQSIDWLCEIVSEASFSVYVCTYSFDERELSRVLENVAQRGVEVRMIFETGVAVPGARVKVDVESSLLHLKFIVVDEERVLLGSANFTKNSLKNSVNDILYIEDRVLANELARFFDFLWNGEIRPFEVARDGFVLRNFDLEEFLLKELSKATKTVDIAMFALTHPKVWSTLKLLSSRGVKIRLLVDRWFLNNSSLRRLPSSGLELKVFEPFTLHTKLFIIDGQVVISGSANATKSGYAKNAELLMAIRKKDLVKQYQEFFERIWQEGSEP